MDAGFDGLFIGGEWRASGGDQWITAINPCTEEVAGTVRAAVPADIDRAVAAARLAFDRGPWSRMAHAERAAVITAAMRHLRSHAEEAARTITGEMGSPISQSRAVQVPRAFQIWEYYAETALAFPWRERRSTYDAFNAASEIIVDHQPVGVIAAIVPWNGPLIVAAMKLAPALLAGCTAVLKPSEEAAMSFRFLADAFIAAGLPAGVLNIVPADRETSDYLARHPDIDKVSLTGSTAAGRTVAGHCAAALKRCTLELGGKGAALILDDVSVDAVVEGLVAPMTFISGQACNAPTRILLPRSRYREIADALSERISSLPFGDPMETDTFIGPLASRRQRDRVRGYLEIGKSEGARPMIGGGVPADRPRGWFVEPTIFADVDHRMRIAQEEIFGPVYCLIAYEGDEDGVRIANDTEYGLQSSVWTSDPDRGLAAAGRIRCGTVGVNSHNLDMASPFGGMKQSGLGRECGVEGFHDYIETRAIMPPKGSFRETAQF